MTNKDKINIYFALKHRVNGLKEWAAIEYKQGNKLFLSAISELYQTIKLKNKWKQENLK
jgi:hypothetical protein